MLAAKTENAVQSLSSMLVITPPKKCPLPTRSSRVTMADAPTVQQHNFESEKILTSQCKNMCLQHLGMLNSVVTEKVRDLLNLFAK